MEVTHINKESDFDFILNTYIGDKLQGFPKYDFQIVLWTTYGNHTYLCSSEDGVLNNLVNDNDKIRVICQNHKLGRGNLMLKVYQWVRDSNYKNEIKLIVEPTEIPIELWDKASDDAPIQDIDIFFSKLDSISQDIVNINNNAVEINERINEINNILTWK